MGKKGSWFSAIKRVFTHNSKDKPINGSSSDNKSSSKEKKKGKGILRHGESKSFIPLFREPSSIEKILGEADQLLIRPHTPTELPKPPPPSFHVRPTSPKVASPKATSPRVSSARITSPKAASPNATSPKTAFPRAFTPGAATASSSKTVSSSPKVTNQRRKEISYVKRPEPTLRYQHLSATKIQAAYRGYLGRRSFRALRGLVRLQAVVRGQNVKRQTMNAMKQMQLLVRVQTQIQSRRIQMLENQALQRRNDKEVESTLSKWTLNQLSEAGDNENWDDSVLTKEEVEARLHKKVEAVIKRERAMAYAYSHRLWKDNPKSAQSPLDIRSNGYPWWWNWLERQLAPESTTTSQQNQAATKTATLTPPRPVSEYKPSPRLNTPTPSPRLTPSNYKHKNFTFDNNDDVTPRSTRSTIPVRAQQQFHATPSRTPGKSPTANYSGFIKYSKPRKSAASSSGFDVPMRDDDSLTSCPPFSVPNYMSPTVSAKAKVRTSSNPKERFMGTPTATPSNHSKRRFSFPLTPNIGPFKWNNNKGSTNKEDSASQKGLEKRHSSHSIGDLSVDSAVSMPAALGRKPFNRFV